jgi:hypothetical protein
MMMRSVVALALAGALTTPASAEPVFHGDLVVVRAGRGQINLETGQAAFKIRGWEFRPSEDSNGMDPASEPITIGIADEKFLIPAGQLRASKNVRRLRYKAQTNRGVQLLKITKIPSGTLKVTLKVAGVDLSTLLITDPPACLSFAVIVGDDDGFSGVSFDRPKPFPSKLLTLPGFCQEVTDWPWL